MNIYSCFLLTGKIIAKLQMYNAYYKPKSFFVEKYFDSWDPKIHGPRNYLQIFYVAALIEEFGTTNHYPLAMF